MKRSYVHQRPQDKENSEVSTKIREENSHHCSLQLIFSTVCKRGIHFRDRSDLRAAGLAFTADSVASFLAALGDGRLDPLLVIFLAMGVLGLLVGAAFLTGVAFLTGAALTGAGAFLDAALLAATGFLAGGGAFLADATDLFEAGGFRLTVLALLF